jgi:hypothetical protein
MSKPKPKFRVNEIVSYGGNDSNNGKSQVEKIVDDKNFGFMYQLDSCKSLVKESDIKILIFRRRK